MIAISGNRRKSRPPGDLTPHRFHPHFGYARVQSEMTTKASMRLAADPAGFEQNPGIPVVFAYGDPDDHLQLVASLASQLSPPQCERAAPCWDPKASWMSRLSAFREVVEHSQQIAVVFDPDALAVTPTDDERWSDAFLRRQRGEFLDELIELSRWRGWIFVRPRPSSSLTMHLISRGFQHPPPAAGHARLDPERLLLNVVAPETRDMAASLLELGALDLRSLRRLLEEADEAGDDTFAAEMITNLAYDALPEAARQQARRLAALRRPESVNGSMGPLSWSDSPRTSPNDATMTRRAFDLLCKRGILRIYSSRGQQKVRLPRDMKALLQRQAEILNSEDHHDLHESMAHREASSVEERAECHYHAVHAENLELAIHDALYTTDLRTMAYRWSHDGRFREAASVYETIVRDFDADDAYAWEYYAWNLAMDKGGDSRTVPVFNTIEDAYQRAHQLDVDNPLFHGRWIGFRAEQGEDVVDEFIRGLDHYTEAGRLPRSSVTWFAEAVIKGWRRGKRKRDEQRAMNEVGPWLKRYPRIRDLLSEQQ